MTISALLLRSRFILTSLLVGIKKSPYFRKNLRKRRGGGSLLRGSPLPAKSSWKQMEDKG
ncbi:MAG: hypothetical protein DRQ04_05515 [Candidatus Hydrothermota bacterium]|nr:MAG: hypothetical protein DRQ04_05515 [Candidatus Hydrothermae bacterium]